MKQITEEEMKEARAFSKEILLNAQNRDDNLSLRPQIVYIACMLAAMTIKIAGNGEGYTKQREEMQAYTESFTEHISIQPPKLDDLLEALKQNPNGNLAKLLRTVAKGS